MGIHPEAAKRVSQVVLETRVEDWIGAGRVVRAVEEAVLVAKRHGFRCWPTTGGSRTCGVAAVVFAGFGGDERRWHSRSLILVLYTGHEVAW